MSRKIKMGVCVAVASSGRPVPIEWAMAIATLAYPVGMNHAWLISKADPNNEAMTRDIQRETLAERALALGTDYMMCFDDDTVPPAHAINSLWYVMAQNPKAAISLFFSNHDYPITKLSTNGSAWTVPAGRRSPRRSIRTRAAPIA